MAVWSQSAFATICLSVFNFPGCRLIVGRDCVCWCALWCVGCVGWHVDGCVGWLVGCWSRQLAGCWLLWLFAFVLDLVMVMAWRGELLERWLGLCGAALQVVYVQDQNMAWQLVWTDWALVLSFVSLLLDVLVEMNVFVPF